MLDITYILHIYIDLQYKIILNIQCWIIQQFNFINIQTKCKEGRDKDLNCRNRI